MLLNEGRGDLIALLAQSSGRFYYCESLWRSLKNMTN